MSECTLHEAPLFQCCCNCKHHWQDFHHCTVDVAAREQQGECICSAPKGWICVGLRSETGRRVHSGWPEHSIGCELYAPLAAGGE